MNRYALWKYLIIAVSLLLGLLYTLPNFYGESPAVQISSLRVSANVDTALLQRVEDALKKPVLKPLEFFLKKAVSKHASLILTYKSKRKTFWNQRSAKNTLLH